MLRIEKYWNIWIVYIAANLIMVYLVSNSQACPETKLFAILLLYIATIICFRNWQDFVYIKEL
jgi:hypothetical protein